MKRMKLFGGALALAAVALLAASLEFARAEEAKPAASANVYELRTYTATPGKMDALNKRFRDHTNQLFIKHGMTPIGYWTPTEGEGAADTLIYILAHKSREEAKKSWGAFARDPEWNKARAESEKDGKLTVKIESRFMAPTDYSPAR